MLYRETQWGPGIAPVYHHCFLDDVRSDLSNSAYKALLLGNIPPKMTIFNIYQCQRCCSSCQHKIENSQRSSPFCHYVPALWLTLNHLHGYCCTVLCLWFPCCWHRVAIAIAAVTSCIAVRAESRSECGDSTDVSWPPGLAAFSLLSSLWWQITLSTWAVNAVMGW